MLSESRKRKKSNYDLWLCALILLLAFGGLIALYSISSVIAYRNVGSAGYFLKKQALFLSLGMAAMLFFAWLPIDIFRRFAFWFMLLALLFLLLVFIPGAGKGVPSSYGSFNRWVRFGPIGFQPSEFAKIAMICYLAAILDKMGRMGQDYDLRRLAFPALLLGLLLGAILLEPQYGTTICMMGAIAVMVYISGFPLLRLLLIALSFLPLLIIMILLWDYRLERLSVWFDPYRYRFDGGYQLVTAFRAFDAGDFFGRQLASGFAHRYLTYGHTDFALALFAEDFGWVGVMLLLTLFALLIWRSSIMLTQVKIPFAYLLGTGILVMLVLQVILNLFVEIGFVPTTGVSLPFLSYGGSSLVTTLSMCGILLNVSRYARKREELLLN